MSEVNPRLKKNNFDLLRLIFALTVCLIHAAELSNQPSLHLIGKILSSKVAVDSFFVISGFLIFMSYEKSNSLYSYAQKRIKRIYPAYITIVLLCAFLLFPFSSINASNYFSSDWIKFIVANLSLMNFLHPNLPGVFTQNQMSTVNGALWTIKIEVMFYFSVPIIVYLLRRFGKLPILFGIYLLSSAYSAIFLALAENTQSDIYLFLEKQLPGQLRYFIAGALAYYYLPLLERNIKTLLACALIFTALSYAYPINIIEPLSLAIIVVFAALFCYAGNFGKYGDFSYGAYITHFPIIQLLTQLGLYQYSPSFGLAITLALTLTSAVLMWHLVEKRFLLRHNHYIEAQNATLKKT